MDYVVVDTSSIIFGLSNKIDVFERIPEELNCKVVVSEGIVNELKKIGTGSGKFSKFGKVAIDLLKTNNKVKLVNDEEYVDNWIIDMAMKNGYKVCTNDIKLKKELKEMGIRAFSLSRNGAVR